MDKLTEDLSLKKPVLGLCYGHQLIAFICGGEVKPGKKREFGLTYAIIDKPLGVLKGLDEREKVWMSHSDTVFAIPKEFVVLAHTENSPVAAFKHKEEVIYGLQWHPEVIHTESGKKMLKNFIFDICGCRANWSMEDFEKSCTGNEADCWRWKSNYRLERRDRL